MGIGLVPGPATNTFQINLGSGVCRDKGRTWRRRRGPCAQYISLKPDPFPQGTRKGHPYHGRWDRIAGAFVHGRGTLYGYPGAGPGMGNSALSEMYWALCLSSSCGKEPNLHQDRHKAPTLHPHIPLSLRTFRMSFRIFAIFWVLPPVAGRSPS